MCGITGLLTSGPTQRIGDNVRAMADRLVHRGPDDGGVWVDADAGVALGHRRLSILDLSPAGHQPMVSACGRYVIAFNGEIYNHLALREVLDGGTNAPTVWRGHSDTETLLAAFARWGTQETLRRAVGMFAIVLWDRQDRVLTLARDRVGEKPLYYGWQGTTFLFGSELKALKAHPEFHAAIDRGALSMLLRHNYVPAPYSIYDGIYKLPPGMYVQLRAGERDVTPTAYWSLSEVAERGMAQPFSGTDDEAVTALEQVLGAAVRSQMVADVPLGALLSGGLDSTAITALMQANSSRPVRTFTIGFGEREYDEAVHARAVAAHLGTEHTELRLTPADALALVPQLPEMYDEPFADSSQLPTHLVMKLARQQVTVALSGDAGDEMLGGYNRHVQAPGAWRLMRRMPELLRRGVGLGLTALPSDAINRLVGPITRHIGVALPGAKAHRLGMRLRGVNSVDDLYVSLVSEWSHPEQMVVRGHMPTNILDQRARWPKLNDAAARMMALDALTYLPDDILVKVDRAAMAVSLETRAPFLDRDVIELAWSLPMQMKIRNGQGKWVLRRMLDKYVPRALVERPKMGFGIPLDEWLRGPLREWAETLLAEDRLRREGYFDPAPIRASWLAHQSGQASNGYQLWSVLMFQSWLEVA